MATHPFFDTFDSIVQESALIQWVDTATKQSRHLGQPGPPQDAAAADFSLRIGWKDHELLVAFHLPVPIRPVPTKAPKHIYVVLPVESLVMGVFYATISSADIPATVRQELQKSGRQADATFLHVNMRLDQPPGVLMHLPQRIKRLITDVPLELLSSLKSLSESRLFNLFLGADDALSQRLFRTCEIVHQRQYGTPSNEAGSKWVKDQWDAFPTKHGTLATPLFPAPLYNENLPVSVPADLAPPIYRRREEAPRRPDVGFQPQGQSQTAASPAETATCCASPEMTATSVCFTDELDMDDSLPPEVMCAKATRGLLATIVEETSARSLNAEQTKLVISATEWLYYAWERDAVAHRTVFADLGKLAVAARTCDYRVFDLQWIRCHQGLVLDNRVEKSNGPFILPLTLKDKIKDLIDFVYTKVDRSANIYILDEVTQLRHASLRVEAARVDENLDEGMAVKDFSYRLAFCVVMAFYKSWGSAELQTV